MASFFRDPKTLPEWIELDYYTRQRALRRWRRVVTWTTLAVSAALIVGVVAWANRRIYQAAPVSDSHRMFNNDCATCHTETFRSAWRLSPAHKDESSVPSAACQVCHEGATHHDTQLVMVGSERCSDCHKEHRRQADLALVPERHCLACHDDLKRNDDQQSEYVRNVTSFAGHPEFAWFREGSQRPDPGTLRFGHARHLISTGVFDGTYKEDGSRRYKVLACNDCHQPDDVGAYMLPVRYQQHCQACHPLAVRVQGEWTDGKQKAAAEAFARQPARHPQPGESPATVRAETRERLTRFALENPVEAPRAAEPERPFPGWERPAALDEKAFAWVNRQLADVERVLFDGPGGCKQCHLIRVPRAADGLPVYALSGINQRDFSRLGKASARWFPSSVFKHETHRMLDCAQCHAAQGSRETQDVLMPNVANCQQCHNPQVGVRSDCVECHRYHDRDKERVYQGTRTIDKALGK